MISSHVKRSPLSWLQNKLRLSKQKTVKVKRFGFLMVFIILEHNMVAWK